MPLSVPSRNMGGCQDVSPLRAALQPTTMTMTNFGAVRGPSRGVWSALMGRDVDGDRELFRRTVRYCCCCGCWRCGVDADGELMDWRKRCMRAECHETYSPAAIAGENEKARKEFDANLPPTELTRALDERRPPPVRNWSWSEVPNRRLDPD